MPPAISSRSRTTLQKRLRLTEQLEPRILLAGDLGSPNSEPTPALISTLTAEGEGFGNLGGLESFGQSLRAAVDEISRVVDAIGSSADLAAEIPYLGSLLPVSVGDTSVIDTASIGALFDLPGRFEESVAGPLRAFLDSAPNASPSQLIAEFDFLDAVPGLTGGIEGVKLNFDLTDQFESSVAALLEPITAGIGGLIDAVDADALATALPFDLSLDGFSFDILKDANEQIAISIPDFSLDLSRVNLPNIDFAADVGFLSGGVVDGEINVDFQFNVDLGNLFEDASLSATSLAGMVSLETLSEIGAIEISDVLDVRFGGDGLDVSLPFDFDLAGFDTGGFLPVFTISDFNPLDGEFPTFGLDVPVGAPYTADALLGFHSIDATDLLSSLEQLGSILGFWEQGSLLDLPVPLGEDVTLGDAIGLAESYGGAVLQFLSDGNGLPTFDSIQELGQLIPGLVSDATGGAISYDPESQLLNLSLDVMRQPDPITTQANLNLFAGSGDSPIASIQATPGDSGLDNRLTITRSASLDLELQIDLSTDSVRPDTTVNLAHARRPDVRGWTSMATILRRLGLGHLTDVPQTLELRLRSGQKITIDMGTADEFTSLDEWLARGTKGVSTTLVQFDFDPFGEDLNEDRDLFDDSVNRFAIRDRTIGTEPTQILSTDEFWTRLLRSTSPDSNEPTLIYSTLLNSPTDLQDLGTPLEKFFPTFATGLQDDSDPLEVTFADGSSRIIDFGPIFGQTIGDLLDALTIVDGDQTILEPSRSGDRIVLRDFTTPAPGGAFSIDWADDGGDRSLGLFIQPGKAIPGTNRIEMVSSLPTLPYDLAAPIDRTTTIGSLLRGTPHEDLIGTTSTAIVTLSNGSEHTISTGLIEEDTPLGVLFGRLFVDDENDVLMAAGVKGDRLFLNDQTDRLGRFTIQDTSDGKGFFQTFFIDHYDGLPSDRLEEFGLFNTAYRIYSDSFSNLPGSQLQRPAVPPIFVDAAEPVPLWTRISTILQRNGDADQSTQRQEATVTLRNGTLIDLIVVNPNSTTVADVLQTGKWYRDVGANSDLIAELTFDGNQLSLHDRTTADETSQLAIDLPSINGSFWPLAVGFGAGSEPDVMRGRPLRTTDLDSTKSNQTALSFLLPADSPYLGTQGSGMLMRLPDGSSQFVTFATPETTTLERILESLTVRRDGVLVTEAQVVNHRIEVTYLGPDGDAPFSMNWDAFNNFGVWPAQFLPIGPATGNTIVGHPFFPSLPGPDSPPVDGNTKVADTFRNQLWLADIEDAVEQTASGTLRDGSNFTIQLGVIDEQITWAEILERFRVRDDNGDLLLEAVLEDDHLVLVDLTEPEDESSFFFFLLSDSGRFFQPPNFTETFTDGNVIDRNDDGRLVSLSLGTHEITGDTAFREIFGDDSPVYDAATPESDILVQTIDSGGIGFGPPNLTPDTTLDQWLGEVNDSVGGRVSFRLDDGRIILSDLSTIDETISSQDQLRIFATATPLAGQLFDRLVDHDYNGEIVSRALWQTVADSRVEPSANLAAYLQTVGLGDVLDETVTSPITVTLLDGTTETFEVRISNNTTLSELAQQFRVVRDGEVVMQGELESVETPFGPTSYRFVLIDHTDPINDESLFSVLIDQSANPSAEAIIPTLIGLTGTDPNGSGRIVGPLLRANSNADRARIKLTDPPRFHAEIAAVATDINAEAKIGELLGVRLENGQGQATAVVDIALVPPAGRDYLTLSELLGSATSPADFLEITVDASINFGGEVYADFAGLNSQPTDPNDIPRIDFAWPGAITNDPNLRFQTDTLSLTHQNLDELLRFDGLTVQDITNLIRKVVDLVEKISGEGLLNKKLPLVNTSLGQVLDTVDHVNELVSEIVNDPNATLDTLEEDLESMLGLEPDELTLTYLTGEHQIRIDLDLGIDAVDQNASFNLDLSDVGLSQLDGLVDLEANGNIGVRAGADLTISLGIDLDELASADFDDAVVIYDTTTVTAGVNVNADDLAFSTSLLGLSIQAGPGVVVLDRDGLKFEGGAQSNEDAIVFVRPREAWPGGFKTLSELSASDFELGFDGEVGVDLPVTFLGDNLDLQIKWDDLSSFGFDVLDADESIDDDGGNQIIVPDLAAAAGNVDFADAIGALATGLQGLFDAIDGYLGDEILGVPIPLIGEALDDMVDFVDNFRGRLSDGLSAEGVIAETASIVIFDALGPGPGGGGLNILDDLNGDGAITIDDVEFSIGDEEASYRLRIGRSDLTASTSIDLGIGGSVLGLDLQGDVNATLGYSFDVGFGISTTEGPFVEFFEGDDISLGFFAGIDDLIGEGRLGPLSVSVRTLDASELTADQRLASRLDPSDPTTETINGIRGAYDIDFGAGRYTLANIFDLFSNVETDAALVGSLHTQINTGINGLSAGLPTLVADLHVSFDSADGDLLDVIETFATPTVSITNVGLDLGSFVSDVLAPVLEPVNDFLDPIRPVLDKLTAPIPGLSDLIGPTSFVDLIGVFGEGGESVGRFIDSVNNIVELIDIPTSAQTIILPLGNFDTVFDNVTGQLAPVPMGGQTNFDEFLDNVGDDAAELRDYLRNIPQEEPQFSSTDPSKIVSVSEGMFSIPLLQNPTSAIGLLFGQDVDLLKYQAPVLNAGFDFSASIPVFPAFSLVVGGQFATTIDFAFGYDTAGIFKFADTGRALDLLDGFFFDDRAVYQNGAKVSDVPELTFRFAVTAGGEIDLQVAKAGVEIGIGAQLNLDLNDPNEDGKVRFGEVLQNLQLGNAPGLGPLWIFDPSGQLDIFVTAYAKAFGIRVQTTLGPKVLVNFDFPRPEPANPELGHIEPDGTLVVHVGPHASLRLDGDLSDGDDIIFISEDNDTGETIITGFGTDQRFSNVTSVLVDGGAGDDQIFVDENYALPVTVYGRKGDDEITGGAGRLTAYGGGGNDVIFGGRGDDRLFGNGTDVIGTEVVTLPSQGTVTIVTTDVDLIDGGAGNDEISGGEEDDQLQGGAGDDRIHGDGGDDYVGGGDGNDALFGGDGDDVVSGDKGDDLVVGESEDGSGTGRDFLQGGPGSDRLEGGPENDELFGGSGSDDLRGGLGNDLLVGAVTTRDNPDFAALQPTPDTGTHFFDGGEGNDLIFGTAGIDTVNDLLGLNIVWTYESADVIDTGDGNDVVRSGAGDDVINVGDGNNEVYAGGGFDIVTAGIGSDLIDLRPALIGGGNAFGSVVTDSGGNNRILGDQGDDLITVTGLGNNFVDVGDGTNIVRTSVGSDTIRTGSGEDVIEAGDGNNDVSSGGGNDSVTTGFGNDRVRLGSGDDVASTGAGADVIVAGSGNDRVDSGSGDDLIRGGSGDDILIAGIGSDTVRGDAGDDVIWGGRENVASAGLFGNLTHPTEYDEATSIVPLEPVVPQSVLNASVEGNLDDGDDLLRGGDGFDLIFGGGGNDDIDGGAGLAYLDGGLGNDLIRGGSGQEVIRGGDGDDDLRGGLGIDFVYGDGGNDLVRGDGGIQHNGHHQIYGQKLFGGSGNDTISAFAGSTNSAVEQTLLGDFIDGGSGADVLLGNLRQELIIGGLGDDRLEGDGLAGPDYGANANPNPFTTGGGDKLFGGFGDDLLLGGGGDDELWGGGNSDELEGHAGEDLILGGGGIDFIRFDVDPAYALGGDTIDGHFDNAPGENIRDDGATDILVIPGTIGTATDDTITLGGNSSGQLVVHYNGRDLPTNFRDADGKPLVEQFQIDGFDGDDKIGFLPSLDLSDLADRSRDWVGVFNGGAGDDILTGAAGRDRLDGGRGSDQLFGFGGDDRLWGDSGEGSSSDLDVLFAGAGNDDLLGGVGANHLYAWSEDPGVPGNDFGIFVNPSTGETSPKLQVGFQLEETGLNRMLGRDGDDLLFAGTGLDFMYGGQGNNTLHGVDGVPIEFGIGVPADEQWLEYARSTDKVWYYGGSGADDIITVDYVTEPGALGDHHLITRLTENNGFFTFDAQVQLDFAATNPDGSLVWDPSDLVYRIDEIGSLEDDDQRELAEQTLLLSGDLLPSEGDYLAIIIDAGDGDDQVFVGPTVQRSVWVAAGDGDDRVEFASGVSLLVDLADTEGRNEVAGDASDFSNAFLLPGDGDGSRIEQTTLFTNLTIDNPRDVDWYEINMQGIEFGDDGKVIVDSISDDDELIVELYELDNDGNFNLLGTGEPSDDAPIDPDKSSRLEIELGTGFVFTFTDARYFVSVRSSAEIPTQYDLGIDLGTNSFDDPELGVVIVNLGVESDTFLRRDVIVGGKGADVLRGGPSEDWVIGGAGNDVLSGGQDGGASDIIIGENGDDIFQIIPSDLSGAELLTLADELEGGAGYDRVMFVGGDLDEFGRSVNDHVSLRYNANLARYEFITKVWDTANQTFLTNEAGDQWVFHRELYRTRGIEAHEFQLRGGNDELHLEPTYYFPLPDGSVDTSVPPVDPDIDPDIDVTNAYGIDPGEVQAGARALSAITVSGGDGNDRIFGSPYADVIDAGSGFDLALGYGGGDSVTGGGGNDLLIGGGPASNVPLFDRLEATTLGGNAASNDTSVAATWLDLSSGQVSGLTLHDGDEGDWYLLPDPRIALNDLSVSAMVGAPDSIQNTLFGLGYEQPTLEIFPAILDPTGQHYVPTSGDADVYLLHVRNPLSSAIIADVAPQTDPAFLSNAVNVTVKVRLDGPFSLPKTLKVTVSPGISGEEIAEQLQGEIDNLSLSGRLFAAYDDQRDRLILQSLDNADLIVEGVFGSNLRFLGFTDGQTNDSVTGPLGEYSLTTEVPFPPVSNGSGLSVAPYQYDLAPPDITFLAPVPTIDLSGDPSAGQPDLNQALRIEGDTSQENLSEIIPVGDLNGDGRADVMLVGNDFAYIFLGDLQPSSQVVSVGATADFVLDISDGLRPIPSIVDLDGDGLDDLSFWRQSESGSRSVFIEILLGSDLIAAPSIFPSVQPGDRILDASDLARTAASFGTAETIEAIDFQWLNFNGDDVLDLMAISRTPVVSGPNSSANLGYGYVYDGAFMAEDLVGSPPAGDVRLIFISDRLESAAVVGGLIDGGLDPAIPRSDELYAVAGDFDGDGDDEIVLTLPGGWTFDSVTVGETLVVSRTYLLDTDGASDLNVELGDSSTADAILQHYEAITNQSFGALSTVSPLSVADLDRDGTDDLIVAREVERGDEFIDALLIYHGQTLRAVSIAADNSADADKRIRGLTRLTDGLIGLDVSAGDFDGDGRVDLAIGQPNSGGGDSAVTVLYDVLFDNGAIRNVSDSFGDARVDSVQILSTGIDNRLGRLPAISVDVTGDRIADLLVGAPLLDSAAGVLDGGGVFVIPGSPRVLGLPDESLVTEIANKSIRGLGDIVADLGDAVVNDQVVLKAGDDTAWFRFTSVGDGAPGDLLRIGPAAVADPSLLIGPVAGNVPSSGSPATDTGKVSFGESDGTGVLEFDLSKLLSAYENPDEITGAKLRLIGSASAPVVNFDQPLNPQYFTGTTAGGGFGERVFFVSGADLWVTDATQAGSSVAFTAPGEPFNLTAVDHRLMFTVDVFSGEEEEEEGGSKQFLYITDGQTTTSVEHPNGDDWEIENFTLAEHDGSLYFINGVSDPQLYRADVDNDGNVTIIQLTQINDASGSFNSSGMQSTEAGMFVTREIGGGFKQLYRSGGTQATTELIGEFVTDGRSTLTGPTLSIGYNGGLLFVADDKLGAGAELWFSDGTVSGTNLLKDVNPGSDGSEAYGFVEIDGVAMFVANDTELWVSDGTAGGTKKSGDLFSPTLAFGINSISTLDSSGLFVAAARTKEGTVSLTSRDSSGGIIQEHDITAGRFVHLFDISAVGDQVILGFNSQEVAFGDAPDRVASWDPNTGVFRDLASETKITHSFGNFVEVNGKVVFDGYIDDTSLNDQVWFSDGSNADPLFDESGGGQTAAVTVTIRGDSHDGQITGPEVDANVLQTHTIQLDASGSEFMIDLADKESNLTQLQELFRLGYRSLIATFDIPEGTGTIAEVDTGRGQGLEIRRSGGVVGQLLDEEGHLIADDFVGLDLRNLQAGTYYVGVSRGEQTSLDEDISLSILIDAPGQGDAHALEDNDLIRGGDGDDVVVGGDGRDALFGDSGRDTFVGEFFEPRDAGPLEVIRNGLATTIFADSPSQRQQRDPLVVIATSPVPAGAINIADINLATRIAGALGVTVVTRGSDTFFAPSVDATDLAGLTHLDASDAGITSFAGLQFLTGLTTLDLSDNGTLANGALTRLIPAANGAEGMPKLRHLNLDGNRVNSTSNLASLVDLRVLSIADQVGAPFTSLAGVSDLTNLVYLDVSGNDIIDVAPLVALENLRAVDLSDNPLQQLSTLTGVWVQDDSPLKVTSEWVEATGTSASSVGGDYHALRPLGDSSDAASWEFRSVKAGQYDVYATWHADPSHSLDATYLAGGNLIGTANQQQKPIGITIGDQTAQWIGTATVGASGALDIALMAGTDLGLVIADAVILRPTGQTASSLARIDARGTLLDANSRTFVVGDLQQQGVIVDLGVNAIPVWSGPAGSFAVNPGDVLPFDLTDFVSDPEGTTLTFTVASNHTAVTPGLQGTGLKIEAPSAVDQVVTVLVTATDADGLTAERSIVLAVGHSLAEGVVVTDTGRAIEGASVYVDENRNGNHDPEESFTTTMADGSYRLLITQDSVVLVESQSHWLRVSPENHTIAPQQPAVHTGRNFEIIEVLIVDRLGTDPINEGDRVEFDTTFGSNLTAGTFKWSVDGDPVLIDGPVDEKSFAFTPENDGTYTVTLLYSEADEEYQISRSVVAGAVAPIADAGDNVTITEGRLNLDRTIIVDPGSDTWDVLVDYGDGIEEKFIDIEERDVTLDHIYGDAGQYTVTITVGNDEGGSTDSFQVTVEPSAPAVELTFSNQAVIEGQSTQISVQVVDPTFQAERFVWAYTIDWGDGTTEDISDSLSFDDQTDRIVTGDPKHKYQSEGTYQVTLTVTDDDGDVQSVGATIVVENGSPALSLRVPDAITESVFVSFEAVATDQDGISTITWDFGDGSSPVEGTNVTHLFADPGTYDVTVVAKDSQGATTTTTQTIVVAGVPEPPSITSIPHQTLVEGQTFTHTFVVTDPDANASFTFSLDGAPVGTSIDSDGRLTWTPTLDQGPAHYDFSVIVTDNGGLTDTTPVSIDVLDTGSISGKIFRDDNFNGSLDATDAVLDGAIVRLDIGNDGTFDAATVTDAQGNYQFDVLPLGLYRVVVDLPEEFQRTTPTEIMVNMDTTGAVVLTPISADSDGNGGGNGDNDGDGVSDIDEINAAFGPDANGDGTPDWLQSHVVSLTSPSAGSVTFVAPVGTTLHDITFGDPPVSPPTNSTFPYGAIRFSLDGLSSGTTADVELLLHGNATITSVFKFGPTPEDATDTLYEAIGASIIEDRIQLQVEDGSLADLDGSANGSVTEEFLLSATVSPWQNPANFFDVNNNGQVSALDALAIINRLGLGSTLPLTNNTDRFYDVTGDRRVTALDAVRVINQLARNQFSGEQHESEGERVDEVFRALANDDDREDLHSSKSSNDTANLPPTSLF